MHAAPWRDGGRGGWLDDIAAHLTADIDIAAVNEFGSCVVAGPDAAIREFTNRCAAAGIVAGGSAPRTRSIPSRWTVLAPFAEYPSTSPFRAANPRCCPSWTGTWMTDEEATDPESLGPAHPLHGAVRRRGSGATR